MHVNWKRVLVRVRKTYRKIRKLDWNDPKNVLMLIGAVMLPIVAQQYVTTGILFGLVMAITVLWIIHKSPVFIKKWIKKHVLLADLILTSATISTMGGYFGHGLILAMSACFCALFLSWALPNIPIQHYKD